LKILRGVRACAGGGPGDLVGRVQPGGTGLVVDVLYEELVLGAEGEHAGVPDEVATLDAVAAQVQGPAESRGRQRLEPRYL
jgi:hypothetical protein